jgi:capsular polysaccharide transport system ATP-binding protein
VIRIQNIVKRYPVLGGERMVLDHVHLDIRRGEKIGILGRNGAGKSTLIRLISGAERPDRGEIIRGMTVSWPIAFGGTFQEQLTGLDNLNFICRIYNRSLEDKIPFVQEFSELGPYFREPVGKYSSGMKARLAFAISMVVEFDCYLIDEVMAVGDDRFKSKCEVELFQKRADRAMIIVSHSPTYIKKHCDKVSVLLGGKLHHFNGVDEGFEFYQLNNKEH